jgi:CheY-like chemotaxis protein
MQQVPATTDTVSMAEAARILALPGERLAALIGERRLMPAGLLDGDLRFRRSDVEALGTRSHARTHHHAVQFYESESFLVDIVTGYVAEGLKTRAPVVVIARPERTRLFVTRLDLDGHGGSEAIFNGELVMLDAHATLTRFMVDDVPDEARFRNIIEPLILRTTRAWPRARLRAYGEMVDVLWEQGNADGALKLENLWNAVARDHSFTLLCGYGMSRFEGDQGEQPFQHVCDTHSDVLPSEACGHASSLAAQRREMAIMQRRIQVLEAQLAKPVETPAPRAEPPQDLLAVPAASVAEAANSPGEAPLPESMTVLVIDDDLPSRRLLVEALLDIRRPRIGILEARSVEQAMRVLDECSPDLCITDFRLSHGQTGLDLFMAARSRGHLAPFVGITGAFVEDQLAEKLLSAGFEDVMLKQQLNDTNLYRIVRNAGLRGRNARRLMVLGTLDELTGVLNRRGYLERLEAERVDC